MKKKSLYLLSLIPVVVYLIFENSNISLFSMLVSFTLYLILPIVTNKEYNNKLKLKGSLYIVLSLLSTLFIIVLLAVILGIILMVFTLGLINIDILTNWELGIISFWLGFILQMSATIIGYSFIKEKYKDELEGQSKKKFIKIIFREQFKFSIKNSFALIVFIIVYCVGTNFLKP